MGDHQRVRWALRALIDTCQSNQALLRRNGAILFQEDLRTLRSIRRVQKQVMRLARSEVKETSDVANVAYLALASVIPGETLIFLQFLRLRGPVGDTRGRPNFDSLPRHITGMIYPYIPVTSPSTTCGSSTPTSITTVVPREEILRGGARGIAPRTELTTTDPRTQAMDPLGIVKKWIGESVMIRQPDPGNGDCLFHSVAQGFARQGIHRTHDRLRQETVQHIQQNAAEIAKAWDHHTPAAPGNSVPCSSIEEYIRLVSQPGAWAGNMELLAISRIHPDHPMLTIGPRTQPTALGNRQQVPPPPRNRISLWLANGHYELLTSIVPEWVWITVWDAGQDTQEQVKTDQTLPPAREDPLGAVKVWAAQTQMHRMPNAGQGDCLFRAMAQAIRRQGIRKHDTWQAPTRRGEIHQVPSITANTRVGSPHTGVNAHCSPTRIHGDISGSPGATRGLGGGHGTPCSIHAIPTTGHHGAGTTIQPHCSRKQTAAHATLCPPRQPMAGKWTLRIIDYTNPRMDFGTLAMRTAHLEEASPPRDLFPRTLALYYADPSNQPHEIQPTGVAGTLAADGCVLSPPLEHLVGRCTGQHHRLVLVYADR